MEVKGKKKKTGGRCNFSDNRLFVCHLSSKKDQNLLVTASPVPRFAAFPCLISQLTEYLLGFGYMGNIFCYFETFYCLTNVSIKQKKNLFHF